MTDDRHRQARTARPLDRSVAKLLCRFLWFPPLSPLLPAEPRLLDIFASATSRVIRLFRHWGYQSGSERVSQLHLSRFVVLPVRPAQYQRRNSRTSVASSRVGAQTSLDVRTSTLVLPTASVVGRSASACLGADRSNAHVKLVGPGVDSPTCHPGPVHSTWGTKPQTVRRQRRRTVSACSQSLTCAITLKTRSGLKDTHVKSCGPGPALCLRREWRLRHSPTVVAGSSRTANCTGT